MRNYVGRRYDVEVEQGDASDNIMDAVVQERLINELNPPLSTPVLQETNEESDRQPIAHFTDRLAVQSQRETCLGCCTVPLNDLETVSTICFPRMCLREDILHIHEYETSVSGMSCCQRLRPSTGCMVHTLDACILQYLELCNNRSAILCDLEVYVPEPFDESGVVWVIGQPSYEPTRFAWYNTCLKRVLSSPCRASAMSYVAGGLILPGYLFGLGLATLSLYATLPFVYGSHFTITKLKSMQKKLCGENIDSDEVSEVTLQKKILQMATRILNPDLTATFGKFNIHAYGKNKMRRVEISNIEQGIHSWLVFSISANQHMPHLIVKNGHVLINVELETKQPVSTLNLFPMGFTVEEGSLIVVARTSMSPKSNEGEPSSPVNLHALEETSSAENENRPASPRIQFTAEVTSGHSLCLIGFGAEWKSNFQPVTNKMMIYRAALPLSHIQDPLSLSTHLQLVSCEIGTAPSMLTENLCGFSFRNCSKFLDIREVERWHIAGDVEIAGCSSLTQLPPETHIQGNLDLAGSSRIRTLPEHLYVSGDLNISDCLELITIGDPGQSIGGSVIATNCAQLCRIGKSLRHVKGSLHLENCSRLTSLPAGLTVEDNLYLGGCRRLKTLPISMGFVGGDLDLWNCKRLISLGTTRLDVGGSIILERCHSLRELPRSLRHVKGSLDLRDCKSLISLPQGLRVDGDLFLHGCKAISNLPDGLIVGGNLFARGCTSLRVLPEDLLIGGSVIDLSYCTRLEHVPLEVLRHPRVGQLCLYLPFTKLATDPIAQAALITLNRTLLNSAQIEFQVDMQHRNSSSSDNTDLQDSTRLTRAAEDFQIDQSRLSELIEPAYRQGVLDFLSRITGSQEYRNEDLRPVLQSRVAQVLHTIYSDPLVRPEMLTLMADSLTACNDKPIWALGRMEMMTEIARARGSALKLRQLGRRIMRLELVDQAALKYSLETMGDDVSIHLEFEIALRDDLNLPVRTSTLIYRRHIPEDVLDEVREEAQAITNAQFETWMTNWAEWQRHLRADALPLYRSLAPVILDPGDPPIDLDNAVDLINLEPIPDPVLVLPGHQVWSYADVCRQYIETGRDFMNRSIPLIEVTSTIRRVLDEERKLDTSGAESRRSLLRRALGFTPDPFFESVLAAQSKFTSRLRSLRPLSERVRRPFGGQWRFAMRDGSNQQDLSSSNMDEDDEDNENNENYFLDSENMPPDYASRYQARHSLTRALQGSHSTREVLELDAESDHGKDDLYDYDQVSLASLVRLKSAHLSMPSSFTKRTNPIRSTKRMSNALTPAPDIESMTR